MTSRAEATGAVSLPHARAFRLVGPAATHAAGRVSLPAPVADDADAYAVVLGPHDGSDADAVARALPDPESLPEGTLVVVLPEIVAPPSLASRLLAAVGRGEHSPRAARCTALVARGYVRVGAAAPDARAKARQELAWGFATGPC